MQYITVRTSNRANSAVRLIVMCLVNVTAFLNRSAYDMIVTLHSRGPTHFITDSDSVVQSSAEHCQHSPTAAVRVYPYLTINGFPYSAFPEYSCLAVTTGAFWCRCYFLSCCFVSRMFSIPAAMLATSNYLLDRSQ